MHLSGVCILSFIGFCIVSIPRWPVGTFLVAKDKKSVPKKQPGPLTLFLGWEKRKASGLELSIMDTSS